MLFDACMAMDMHHFTTTVVSPASSNDQHLVLDVADNALLQGSVVVVLV